MSAKFSRMATALSLSPENKSSYILSYDDEMSSDNSGRLLTPMPRVPIRDVLLRRMREAGGINVPELARRAAARRRPISETAIKSILQGKTGDPQVSTLEAVAVGLDLSPLRFIAEVLGINPDDPALKAEDFRLAHELYKDLTPTQQQKASHHIAGLLVNLKYIKNLPK